MSPKTSSFARGRDAEERAAEYLERLGYRIIGRNVRVGRLGEIDLVAYDGEVLVFIEVKARSSKRFGLPEDALTLRKQRRLLEVARAYLSLSGLEGIVCRFDVIALELGAQPPAIRLYRNAFGSEEAL